MAERLKVLVSAYACEPHRGSEPETGWQWGLQMAAFHDVTVLTRSNNKPPIEKELSQLSRTQPVPRFIYHDPGYFWQRLKKTPASVWWYYALWQRTAQDRIAQLLQRERFDLLHHITFVTFRFNAAIWGHGLPSIWGPIGGAECYPWKLLPRQLSGEVLGEMLRNVVTTRALNTHGLQRRARKSDLVLAVTPEMQSAITRLGVAAELFPTIAYHPPAKLPQRSHNTDQPLKLLFVGRLVMWKGLDLLLHALAGSQTDAHLTIIGDGPFRRSIERLVARLGLSNLVRLLGRLPQAETLAIYRSFDVFAFPSVHDSGGNVVLEAMVNGLPVLCLDAGGPGVTVDPRWGTKIPLADRSTVVRELAAAIRRYDQDRNLVQQQSDAARRAIGEHFNWSQKAATMDAIYRRVVRQSRTKQTATEQNR